MMIITKSLKFMMGHPLVDRSISLLDFERERERELGLRSFNISNLELSSYSSFVEEDKKEKKNFPDTSKLQIHVLKNTHGFTSPMALITTLSDPES